MFDEKNLSDCATLRRYLCRLSAGAACRVREAEDAAHLLIRLCNQGKTEENIAALNRTKELFGVRTVLNEEAMIELARVVLRDLYGPREVKSFLPTRLVPESRVKIWRDAGLLPGGIKDEIMHALEISVAEMGANHQELMKEVLRLGIAAGVYGLLTVRMLSAVTPLTLIRCDGEEAKMADEVFALALGISGNS